MIQPNVKVAIQRKCSSDLAWMENKARRKKPRKGTASSSPCLLLLHSAMQFVASHPVLFAPIPSQYASYTRMPTASNECQSCFKRWRPWGSLQSIVSSHPSELLWMPLSSLGRHMTFTQGFWVLITCISTKPFPIGKCFAPPEFQRFSTSNFYKVAVTSWFGFIHS